MRGQVNETTKHEETRLAQDTDEASTRRRSEQNYPEDRFDAIPRSRRVGVHRLVPKPRHAWRYVVAGVLAFALLTTGGILWLQTSGSSTGSAISEQIRGEEEAPEPPQVVPELDPEATIAIINGTEVTNLATALDTIITENEWGQILFTGDADTSDVEISAVFYADPADEAVAAGLAAELGGISTYENVDYASYGSRLVVLLGSDYAGPGRDEAEQLTTEGGAEAAPESNAEDVEAAP
ncbi:MAG: LytR C-terminal domain-containing protein [Leucobacter sp.]